MLALTKRTDYAIIALAHIARTPDQIHTAREIAERFRIPHPLLMNVLKSLCHGELLRSRRGVKGGYALSQPAERITLHDIIRAVEGPIRFVQCAAGSDGAVESCELMGTCPVSRPVRRVHHQLTQFLSAVTLAQIAGDYEHGFDGVPLALSAAGLSDSTE